MADCAVGIEAREESVEVFAGVGPVKGGRGRVVAVLEAEDPVGELVEVGEVAGSDGLALEDREVDLDLVEPGSVDGEVDQFGGWPRVLHAVDGGLPAVGGAVVDHQKTRFAEA